MASNGMFDISYVIDILYYIGIDDYWGIGVMIWQYSAFHSIVRVELNPAPRSGMSANL